MAKPLETSALAHAKNAAGRRHLVEGYSFSPERDLHFALGWPHMVFLDPDGAEGDREPALVAEQLYSVAWWQRSGWPKGAAGRLVRLWTAENPSTWASGELRLTDEGEAAARCDVPVDAAFAAEAVALLLAREHGSAITVENALLMLEALVGPGVIVDTMVEVMREWTPDQWLSRGRGRYVMVLHLGLLLPRLTKSAEAKAQKRLAALLDSNSAHLPAGELSERGAEEPSSALRALDIAVHGAPGVLRSGTYNKRGWIAWHELPFAAGDPAYVAACLERGGSPADSWPDPRTAFIGGEATLQLMISWWKRYKGADAQRLIVEGLGQIRSEAIVSLMVDMSAKSRVKTAVRAWFQTHRDYAGPILEAAARSRGARASLAKKVLQRLGD